MVREILGRPEVAELLGDLAQQVEVVVLDQLAAPNLAYREGVSQKLAAVRRELAGESPTPIEAALAERAALSWLMLHQAELSLAQVLPTESKRADFWDRRVAATHRRYLAAVKALAAVRRLAVPVPIGQVNIAEKQVNKAGPMAAS